MPFLGFTVINIEKSSGKSPSAKAIKYTVTNSEATVRSFKFFSKRTLYTICFFYLSILQNEYGENYRKKMFALFCICGLALILNMYNLRVLKNMILKTIEKMLKAGDVYI